LTPFLLRYGIAYFDIYFHNCAGTVSANNFPFRLLGSIQDNLAQGQPDFFIIVGVAAWLQFLVEHERAQTNFCLIDPKHDK